MSKTLEQKLSLLMDGEITPFETKRLVDEIHTNSNFKSLWLRMNKHKAAMHGELLDHNLDLSQQSLSHKFRNNKNLAKLRFLFGDLYEDVLLFNWFFLHFISSAS